MKLPKEIIQAFGLIEESDSNDEFLAEEGIWTQGEGEEDIWRELMFRGGESLGFKCASFLPIHLGAI